jgi:hypothetical protein
VSGSVRKIDYRRPRGYYNTYGLYSVSSHTYGVSNAETCHYLTLGGSPPLRITRASRPPIKHAHCGLAYVGSSARCKPDSKPNLAKMEAGYERAR